VYALHRWEGTTEEVECRWDDFIFCNAFYRNSLWWRRRDVLWQSVPQLGIKRWPEKLDRRRLKDGCVWRQVMMTRQRVHNTLRKHTISRLTFSVFPSPQFSSSHVLNFFFSDFSPTWSTSTSHCPHLLVKQNYFWYRGAVLTEFPCWSHYYFYIQHWDSDLDKNSANTKT